MKWLDTPSLHENYATDSGHCIPGCPACEAKKRMTAMENERNELVQAWIDFCSVPPELRNTAQENLHEALNELEDKVIGDSK